MMVFSRVCVTKGMKCVYIMVWYDHGFVLQRILQAQRIPLSMNKPLPQNIAWREDAGNSTPSKGPLKRSRESEKNCAVESLLKDDCRRGRSRLKHSEPHNTRGN